jgi:hypothetical protein
MTEKNPSDKIKAARTIEKGLEYHNLEIRNFIDYLRVTASAKHTLVPCGCVKSDLAISPSFHRSFKTLTE